jgi:hypothetical protein
MPSLLRTLALAAACTQATAITTERSPVGVAAWADPNDPVDVAALDAHLEARAEAARNRIARVRSSQEQQQEEEARFVSPGTRRALLTTAEQQSLLDAHNSYRSTTAAGGTPDQPSASDMNELFWDPALAAVAQAYADKCVWEHNPNRQDETMALADQATFAMSNNQQVGENLYLTSSKTTALETVGLNALEAFYEEHEYYTFSTDDCTDVCGHYTQVVWADTRYVGCGTKVCSSVTGGFANGGTIVVCNYANAGNWPTQPYTSGTACSSCPSDRPAPSCSSSMCSGCMRPDFDTCSGSACEPVPECCDNGLGVDVVACATTTTAAAAGGGGGGATTTTTLLEDADVMLTCRMSPGRCVTIGDANMTVAQCEQALGGGDDDTSYNVLLLAHLSELVGYSVNAAVKTQCGSIYSTFLFESEDDASSFLAAVSAYLVSAGAAGVSFTANGVTTSLSAEAGTGSRGGVDQTTTIIIAVVTVVVVVVIVVVVVAVVVVVLRSNTQKAPAKKAITTHDVVSSSKAHNGSSGSSKTGSSSATPKTPPPQGPPPQGTVDTTGRAPRYSISKRGRPAAEF